MRILHKLVELKLLPEAGSPTESVLSDLMSVLPMKHDDQPEPCIHYNDNDF